MAKLTETNAFDGWLSDNMATDDALICGVNNGFFLPPRAQWETRLQMYDTVREQQVSFPSPTYDAFRIVPKGTPTRVIVLQGGYNHLVGITNDGFVTRGIPGPNFRAITAYRQLNDNSVLMGYQPGAPLAVATTDCVTWHQIPVYNMNNPDYMVMDSKKDGPVVVYPNPPTSGTYPYPQHIVLSVSTDLEQWISFDLIEELSRGLPSGTWLYPFGVNTNAFIYASWWIHWHPALNAFFTVGVEYNSSDTASPTGNVYFCTSPDGIHWSRTLLSYQNYPLVRYTGPFVANPVVMTPTQILLQFTYLDTQPFSLQPCLITSDGVNFDWFTRDPRDASIPSVIGWSRVRNKWLGRTSTGTDAVLFESSDARSWVPVATSAGSKYLRARTIEFTPQLQLIVFEPNVGGSFPVRGLIVTDTGYVPFTCPGTNQYMSFRFCYIKEFGKFLISNQDTKYPPVGTWFLAMDGTVMPTTFMSGLVAAGTSIDNPDFGTIHIGVWTFLAPLTEESRPIYMAYYTMSPDPQAVAMDIPYVVPPDVYTYSRRVWIRDRVIHIGTEAWSRPLFMHYNRAIRFDSVAGSWLSSVPTKSCDVDVSAYQHQIGRYLYLARSTVVNQYDTVLDSWQSVPLPESSTVSYRYMASFDGEPYFLGGWNRSVGQDIVSVLRMPSFGVFEEVAPLLSPAEDIVAGTIGGRHFLIYSSNVDTYDALPEVYEYRPADDKWVLLEGVDRLPSAWGTVAVAVGQRLYVAASSNSSDYLACWSLPLPATPYLRLSQRDDNLGVLRAPRLQLPGRGGGASAMTPRTPRLNIKNRYR